MIHVRSLIGEASRILSGAAFRPAGLPQRTSFRLRWTLGELMLGILLIGLTLALLRIRWGLIFALMAGGVVGCGMAPWHAVRAMRKLDGELATRPDVDPRVKATLVAQSYVFVWAAWYFAGVLVALTGAATWWLLGQAR